MRDCEFCPRSEAVSGARCRSCGKFMCSVCVETSPDPPDDHEDVNGYEHLIYDADYRGGDFYCTVCRDEHAYELVQDYRDAGPWPTDPLLWVASATHYEWLFDDPEIDDDYDLTAGILAVAQDWRVQTVSARRTTATRDTPERWETVSGLLIRNATTSWRSLGPSAYGDTTWTGSLDVLVVSDGSWYSVADSANRRTLRGTPTWGRKWETGHWGEGTHSDDHLVPGAFIEAAKAAGQAGPI